MLKVKFNSSAKILDEANPIEISYGISNQLKMLYRSALIYYALGYIKKSNTEKPLVKKRVDSITKKIQEKYAEELNFGKSFGFPKVLSFKQALTGGAVIASIPIELMANSFANVMPSNVDKEKGKNAIIDSFKKENINNIQFLLQFEHKNEQGLYARGWYIPQQKQISIVFDKKLFRGAIKNISPFIGQLSPEYFSESSILENLEKEFKHIESVIRHELIHLIQEVMTTAIGFDKTLYGLPPEKVRKQPRGKKDKEIPYFAIPDEVLPYAGEIVDKFKQILNNFKEKNKNVKDRTSQQKAGNILVKAFTGSELKPDELQFIKKFDLSGYRLEPNDMVLNMKLTNNRLRKYILQMIYSTLNDVLLKEVKQIQIILK